MNSGVISFLILLTIFRFQLLALLDLREFTRILILLPIVYLSFLVFRIFQKHRIKVGPEILFLGVPTLLGLSYVLIQFGTNQESLSGLLSQVSSTHLFLIFPLFFILYLRSLEDPETEIIKILDFVALVTVVLGGAAIMIEYAGYRQFWWTNVSYKEWLIPQSLTEILGEGYQITFHSHARALGPLAVPHLSAFLMASLTLYLFGRFQDSQIRWAFIFLTVITLFLTGTFLGILGFAFLLILLYGDWRSIVRMPRSFADFGGIFAFILAIVWLVTYSPMEERILEYWRNGSQYWSHFTPNLQECSTFSFWGPVFSTEFCDIREIKIVSKVFSLGLIPTLPWVFILFLPLFWIRRLPQRHTGRAVQGLFLMQLFSTLHYPSMESWGNNYVFALAAVFIVWPSSRARQDTRLKSVEQP